MQRLRSVRLGLNPCAPPSAGVHTDRRFGDVAVHPAAPIAKHTAHVRVERVRERVQEAARRRENVVATNDLWLGAATGCL